MAKGFRLGLDFQVFGDGMADSFRIPSLVTGTLTNGRVKSGSWNLAATTTLDLWSSAESPASFELLVLVPDIITNARIIAELTIDRGNDVGDELFTVELKNGFPFILGADDGYANYTANFGGGTLDVIDRIRIRNIGSAASTGRFLIGN